MKRVMILSGAKLLRNPKNLYYIVRMIRPDLVPGFYEFGYRWCDPRHSFDGIDFNYSGNLHELKQILEKRVRTR
jgi:SWI/SNF-related matrix-associated actin-dependent regulator 1 of chromatin subfamily A